MSTHLLVKELLALPGLALQKQFVADCVATLPAADQDQVANQLKAEADQFLRSDIQRCLETADLILHLAALTANQWHRALGLRVKANAYCYGGLGKYREAITLYDEAADIYGTFGHLVHQAGTQYAKITALASLGQHEEALQIGQWAMQVFESQEEWLLLGKLLVNLGSIYYRLGEDGQALALFDRACKLYRQLGDEGDARSALARAEQNRNVMLRHLGRFDEAVAAGKQAQRMLQESGQRVEAARAQQNLAVTYFVLGRYNEALALLDEARDVFLADGRQRDAILIDLFTSDCLLQLRRFTEVLEKCSRVRSGFTELGTRFEVGQSILNEAVAYAGLQRYEEALQALAETRQIFMDEGNKVWVASTDVETAVILSHQGEAQASFDLALACANIFAAHDFPVEEAQAFLIAAQAALQLGQQTTAQELIATALPIAESQALPTLAYQAYYLLGALARTRGNLEEARTHFERATTQLEQLRGRLMVEFRADFLEDKQTVYEDLVQLSLDLGEAEQGLAYAERAKSRALLELLAFRLDLSLEARTEADKPLVAELTRLRNERDRLYRRWEAGEVTNERGRLTAMAEGQQQAQKDVLVIEKRITELWHRLLIRNADYARDAALWQIRNEPIQPYLAEDTILVAYFVTKGELVAFLVTREMVRAIPLSVPLPQIQRSLQLMWLNLKAVPRSKERLGPLLSNMQGVLHQLHNYLIAPLAEALAGYKKLIVVPHGSLHYLPFHALYDGTGYLLEQFETSYLPGASFLCYRGSPSASRGGLAAFGHSYNGRLPHTNEEARTIAQHWQGQVWLEEAATLAALQNVAPKCQILHLATHAEFRPDNPLFSGLALADGWLTTLDTFNLRLQASLVTLSACQTGRNVVGGGDELFGLMRAFLSAGAASLVLSLWAVEDHSTKQFMQMFYQALADGFTKGGALQQVQRLFIENRNEGGEHYQHPYFWAPFYLVGDAGPL
jgi:CHAT domain-containing protein/tetratricopeptide (TPR) repeat protein